MFLLNVYSTIYTSNYGCDVRSYVCRNVTSTLVPCVQRSGSRQVWSSSPSYRHQPQDINNTNDPQKKYPLRTVSKNILLEGLNQFHGANFAFNLDVDNDTFGKVTKHNKYDSQEVSPFPAGDHKATTKKHDTTTHTNMKHNE